MGSLPIVSKTTVHYNRFTVPWTLSGTTWVSRLYSETTSMVLALLGRNSRWGKGEHTHLPWAPQRLVFKMKLICCAFVSETILYWLMTTLTGYCFNIFTVFFRSYMSHFFSAELCACFKNFRT